MDAGLLLVQLRLTQREPLAQGVAVQLRLVQTLGRVAQLVAERLDLALGVRRRLVRHLHQRLGGLELVERRAELRLQLLERGRGGLGPPLGLRAGLLRLDEEGVHLDLGDVRDAGGGLRREHEERRRRKEHEPEDERESVPRPGCLGRDRAVGLGHLRDRDGTARLEPHRDVRLQVAAANLADRVAVGDAVDELADVRRPDGDDLGIGVVQDAPDSE